MRIASNRGFEHRERVARWNLRLALSGGLTVVADQRELGVPTDERPPGPALPTFQRLEKEAVVVAYELLEDRHGGLPITEDLHGDGHHGMVLGESGEAVLCE
jgi:hypothetical protein